MFYTLINVWESKKSAVFRDIFITPKSLTPRGRMNIYAYALNMRGDDIAPVLFNVALHKAVLRLQIDWNGTIMNKRVQIVAYADDVVITGGPKKQRASVTRP